MVYYKVYCDNNHLEEDNVEMDANHASVIVTGITTHSQGTRTACRNHLNLYSSAFTEDPFEAPDYFSEFEAAHPGVKVVLAPSSDNTFFTSPGFNIEDHLDGAAEYAASADVLYVNENNLSVEATRAGYFLDLAPLTAGDPTFSPEDFFPMPTPLSNGIEVYGPYQWQ